MGTFLLRLVDEWELGRPHLVGPDVGTAGDRFVESMAYVRSYPSDLPLLAERLGDIRTPVQIIAGRHDALVPPSNAEFLHARLAHSKLDILETGHFAWEEGADEYLELTRSWIEAHSTAGSRP